MVLLLTARGPDGCRGADALIEVFKDKRLELLLKYSQVLFLESSKVWGHFRSSQVLRL